MSNSKTKIPKCKYDLVLIVWEDAHSTAHWIDANEVSSDPCYATTVGFLFKQDDARVVVVDSIIEVAGMETISGMTTIPKGMVKELYVIKKGKGGN